MICWFLIFLEKESTIKAYQRTQHTEKEKATPEKRKTKEKTRMLTESPEVFIWLFNLVQALTGGFKYKL